MKKLDGSALAKKIKTDLKLTISNIEGRKPKLAVMIVGEDPASMTYVNSKAKQCKAVGMESVVERISEEASELEVLNVLNALNQDPTIDAILVQLPLPNHLDENKILDAINPEKDVDGLTTYNVGRLAQGRPTMVPCTPKGVMSLLDAYDIDVSGMRALVIGRSRLVGRPLSMLLEQENATVTLAHSRTKNLELLIQENELIVVAIGKPHFVKVESLLTNHIIVDVGIHPSENGLVGDVEPSDKVRFMSPVPGGVGPMTIASLLENTVQAYFARTQNAKQ